MSLYEQWKDLANMQQTQQAQAAFWSEYFNAETENYKKFWPTRTRYFPESSPSWQRNSA